MSLVDRLTGRKTPATAKAIGIPVPEAEKEAPKPTPAAPAAPRASTLFTRAEVDELSAVDQLKVDIHHRLISRLDLEALEQIKDEGEVTTQIRLAVGEFLRTESTPLSQAEREEIVEHIVWEITGLGPIEPFFRDPSISDILVNNAHNIFIERKGKLHRVHAQFFLTGSQREGQRIENQVFR